MRKQTVWLLVTLFGVYAVFLVAQSVRVVTFQKLMAQVGIAVGVAPNPYNSLNDQLNQKQDQLNQEASGLAAQEAAFASSTTQETAPTSPVIWYLAAAVGVIAMLIGLNFYFDWRRSRKVV